MCVSVYYCVLLCIIVLVCKCVCYLPVLRDGSRWIDRCVCCAESPVVEGLAPGRVLLGVVDVGVGRSVHAPAPQQTRGIEAVDLTHDT